MTADLCDAVLEDSGSGGLLLELAESNQLVVPLDPLGRWYRYHTLLREHLRAVLAREPDHAAALHHRAAAWYAGHGQPAVAVEHLFAAGDAAAAAAQISAVILPLVRGARETTVSRWLARLDEATLRRHPYVAVIAAWLHAIRGEVAEAERLVDLPDGAGYGATRPPGAEMYEAARASVLALMARDGLATAVADAERGVLEVSRLSPWRPAALAVLGAIVAVADDVDRGDALLDEAASLAELLGGGRAHVFAQAWRALGAIERGDWPAADARVRDTVGAEARYLHDPDATSAAGRVAAARVAIHRGQLAEARRELAAFQVSRTALQRLPGSACIAFLEAAWAILPSRFGGRPIRLQQAGDILARRPDLGAGPRGTDA
jgi:LuxR family maltose regulon positive regulatory protein